ncbi:MAG: hypothetical protein U0414_02955 [Polyangiaceae bacterium]
MKSASSARPTAQPMPGCISKDAASACRAGSREACVKAFDDAFRGCDFQADDFGVEFAKDACDLGVTQGCLTYGSLLFTRVPAPHERPDVQTGRAILGSICDAARPGMRPDDAEARRAACDRLAVRLAATADASWEKYATKACELGGVDACVRLAAKTPGAAYLDALTKLCLQPEVGNPELVGAPLAERPRESNRLLRVCAEVLTKRDAKFDASPEAKGVRARAQSLDAAGLLGYYLGTDPPPDGDANVAGQRVALLLQTACAMGDEHACIEAPYGQVGDGACTLWEPERCALWAKGIVMLDNVDQDAHQRAERLATRACRLDDSQCDALGQVLQVIRNDAVRAKEAYERACRAQNLVACRAAEKL